MNATYLYAIFLSLLCSSSTYPQHLKDGNFVFDTEVDFPDFILPPKNQVKAPVRVAKPRSPVISNVNPQNKVTPVPILKQINRHNENGSYTYGFESADGSFKIETKLASGEVIGKYGYVDDSGKLRVVEYGANKYGFQPAGEGITIPPITVANETYPADTNTRHHYVSKPEIRILSKHNNPKRKPQKPVQFFPPERQRIRSQPHYSVLEQEDSVRVESPKSIITPADLNALQLFFGHELRDNPTLQGQRKLPPTNARFEESSADSNRPPFAGTFPIPTIFDSLAIAPSEFTHSALHQQPYEGSTNRPQSAKTSRSRGKPKWNPQLPMVSAVEEVPAPVRRSSNAAHTVYERGSILDELIKKYAIPNGSPAIHDFSFSYNGDPRVMRKTHEMRKLAQLYARSQFTVCKETFIELEDVPGETISLRSAATKESKAIGGHGQGFVRCNCISRCKTKRCQCAKNGIICSSKCHSSSACCNK